MSGRTLKNNDKLNIVFRSIKFPSWLYSPKPLTAWNVNLLDNKSPLFSLGCPRVCIVIFSEKWKSAPTAITTDSSFRANLWHPFFGTSITRTIRKVCVTVDGGSSIRGGWNWEQRATSWSSRWLCCHVGVFAARLITCIDQQRGMRGSSNLPQRTTSLQSAYSHTLTPPLS